MGDKEFYSIPIRYDGGDAGDHVIELSSLAESLKGIEKIIASVGHYHLTGQYVRQSKSLKTRVYAREPKANCFSVDAFLIFADQHELFAGAGTAVIDAVIAYAILKLSNKVDAAAKQYTVIERLLKERGRDQKLLYKQMQIVEKMVEGLHPSMKRAVEPIGNSCETLKIGVADSGIPVIDQAAKDEICDEEPDEILPEQEYLIQISEVDRDNDSCKVRIEGDDLKRYKARISDPLFKVPNNPYMKAISSFSNIRVRAKAALKNGAIKELNISDIA